ncbi:MAG: helix-turn-helix transcriptional regulator [Actinomycetota bacterium]
MGRGSELDALQMVLRQATPGRLRAGLIEGESGIGKTRLVAETLAAAPEHDFAIFSTACEEYESARSFASLARAFGCTPGSAEPRRAAIAELLDRDAGEIESIHFRLIDRFVDLIEASALERPLLLVVEDLHWADPATIATLRAIMKRLRFVPLAVVGTTRPLPRSPEMNALIGALEDDEALVLRLDALPETDVARFVETALGTPPDPSLMRFMEGAAGNPLFLTELLGALVQDDSIRVEAGRATISGTSLPPGLQPTILRRISYLSDPAMEMLRAAATLGSSFSPRDVASVLGTDLKELIPPIEESLRARVVEEHGTALRFRHDLIRDALYFDRPESVRRELHMDAAKALRAAGAPVRQVAEQYALGGRAGDPDAIATIRAAALTVERSPATRAELLERALALTNADDPIRNDIRADLAEAMVAGGRPDDALALARDLVTAADISTARRMRAVTLQALRLSGRWVELAELAGAWLDQWKGSDDERAGLLAAAAYARGSSITFDPAEAMMMAGRALRLAEELNDEAVIVAALVAHVPAMTRSLVQDLHPLVKRAADIAEKNPIDPVIQHHPHYYLGRILLVGHLGDVGPGSTRDPDLEGAESALRIGMRLAEQAGRASDLPLFLDGLAHVHYYADRWDDALAEAEAAIAAAAEVGTRTMLLETHSIIAHISILRGQLERAEEHVRAEEEIARELGPQMEEPFLAHRSMLAELRGELAEALQYRWTLFEREAAIHDSVYWWICLWYALETDDADKVAILLDWLDRRAVSKGTDEAALEASFAHALASGDKEGVRSTLESLAAEGWDRPQHERTAMAMARAGLRQEALEHFREAAAYYDRVAARAWHDQRARQLQRHGVRVPRRRRARPATGWESLTGAEGRIARFASEGMTNPQIAERLFVSPRTIQTHLAHIFQKLSISSRVELAAEVARIGEAPD